MTFTIAGKTPGDREETEEGGEGVICAVVNSLSVYLLFPVSFYENVVRSSGLKRLCWPLGVNVTFTVEGAVICVFGHTTGGRRQYATSFVEFHEEAPSAIGGVNAWHLWKALRNTPVEVVKANLVTLKEATTARLQSLN
jgi:hypothetical protein